MMVTYPLQPGGFLQNRYVIQRQLGQGGFGAVYLGADTRLGNKHVAIKENFDSSPEAQSQFRTEANLLANLSHQHLPRVTDHFIEPNGRQYLVMDYVAGQDLQTMIENNSTLSIDQAIRWTVQVLNALEYLHKQTPPVIHRDIKPSNIRITPENKAILVDFGISKAAAPTAKTATGARAVSPGFSPVEQYGHGRTNARSDLYALGATLYFALTGYAPPEAIQRITGQAQVIPPRQINPTIPANIETAILTAMQSNMDQRYHNAAEMKQMLIGSPSQPRRSTTPRAAINAGSGTFVSGQQTVRPRVAAPPIAQKKPAAKSLPLGLEAAGIGARFAAYVIDSFISAFFGLLGVVPVLFVDVMMEAEGALGAILGTVIVVGIQGWYFTHFHAKTGQTWGKMWLHIQVVDANGNTISKSKAFWRWVLLVLPPSLGSFILPGISFLVYLLPLFDKQRRGLHDLICKTWVVKA